MFRLDEFKITDMMTCGADIREFGPQSSCVEEAAEKVVNYLFNTFRNAQGEPALPLVRLFKTLRFDELDDELKRRAISDCSRTPDTKYLVLMASVGVDPTWNSPRDSMQHRLIPISDGETLKERMPMISQMFEQLELERAEPTKSHSGPELFLSEPGHKRFNVFYVPNAGASDYIPDKTMVAKYQIQTVIGYGGLLNRSSAYCVVMFSNTFVSRESAELFNPISLSTKNALIYARDFRPLVGRRELA